MTQLSEEDHLRRLAVLRNATGSLRLEGLSPPTQAIELGCRWAAGEISIQEAIKAFQQVVVILVEQESPAPSSENYEES